MMKNSFKKYELLLFCSLVGIVSTVQATRKTYNSASSFKTAIQNASPGDTIELANGSYDLGGNSITKSGTADQRIVLKAQNRGMAELKGKSSFACKGISYLTIEGFLFTSDVSTVIKTESSNNIRITRNTFRLSETTSSKWVLIGGTYNIATANSFNNRIDHNLFENKQQLGNYITIDGSPADLGTPEASRYDRIDHNHFRNIGPRAVNEMETIRIGQSEICRSSSYTVVEYNLFEECDGDPEIVSVKTKNVTVRNNTFRRSQGTVCLRSSDSSIVEGNYFLGGGKAGTGGVRLYGSGHKVFNNYFENLTGDTWDAACAITNGDAELTGSNTAHWRPQNIIVAFNTFVNNANNFQFGFTNIGKYSKPPNELSIANNLVVGSQNQLVKILTQPSGITYSGNIMFPQGSATIGVTAADAEIKNVDPQLVFADSVWRLSPESPAANAATGTFDFISSDIEGQSRDGLFDIGADEISASQKNNRPLTVADVGPDGPDSIAVVTSAFRNERTGNAPSDFVLYQNHPNPFNPTTQIKFQISEVRDRKSESNRVLLKVYNLLGQEVAALVSEELPPGIYAAAWNAEKFSSGMYVVRLAVNGKQSTMKMVLQK